MGLYVPTREDEDYWEGVVVFSCRLSTPTSVPRVPLPVSGAREGRGPSGWDLVASSYWVLPPRSPPPRPCVEVRPLLCVLRLVLLVQVVRPVQGVAVVRVVEAGGPLSVPSAQPSSGPRGVPPLFLCAPKDLPPRPSRCPVLPSRGVSVVARLFGDVPPLSRPGPDE